MRTIFAGLFLCFTTTQALAASPRVEAAIKVLAAIGANPQKLRLFCEFMDAGDNEARSNRLMRRLGADFKSAWEVGDDLDENSADGKVYFGVINDLVDECTDLD